MKPPLIILEHASKTFYQKLILFCNLKTIWEMCKLCLQQD